MKARFITFEGLDGSGKSTHVRRAAAWCRARSIAVLETQEPGGTSLGEAIRSVFLDRQWGVMDGRVEAMLVFASRRQHLIEVIDPALEKGTTVLCDRFTDSTLAYQGFGRGVSLDVLGDADELATGRRVPDHTVLFDLPATTARGRGQSEQRAESGAVDRLDAEELEFYERVRAGYLELARRDPDARRLFDLVWENDPERFFVVDSSGTIEETEEQLGVVLDKLFGAEAS